MPPSVRHGRKNAARTLPAWWWWTARTCFLTPSLWSAGSATWICSLETGCCWGSACTASASEPALGHGWAVWMVFMISNSYRYVCAFLSWAESVCVQSSCWAKSRRCRVPTEMTPTPVPAPCRRERSEPWVTQTHYQCPPSPSPSPAATLAGRLAV